MTRDEAFRRACALLEDRGVEDAALEAEVLLRHTLDISCACFHAERRAPLTRGQGAMYWAQVARRVGGLPLAYITGVRDFYGLEFLVDGRVLIPRPETELLVEKAIECARRYEAPQIADIGTGCGAIAVSLAFNLPQAKIIATDVSPRALETARRNCVRHSVRDQVVLLEGDLLEPLTHPVDIIVANLPYVRTADLPQVNTHGWEPRLALDGGEDGLDVIRRLCGQVCFALKPGGSLLLETGAGQSEAVGSILRRLFTSEKQSKTTDRWFLDSSLRWNDNRGQAGNGADSPVALCQPTTPRIKVFPDLAGIDRVVYMALQ